MSRDNLFSKIPKLIALLGVLPVLLLVLWLEWIVVQETRHVQTTWTRVEALVLAPLDGGMVTLEFPWRHETISRQVPSQGSLDHVYQSQKLPLYINPANLGEVREAPFGELWGGAIIIGIFSLVLAGACIFLLLIGGGTPDSPEESAALSELDRLAANPRSFDRPAPVLKPQRPKQNLQPARQLRGVLHRLENHLRGVANRSDSRRHEAWSQRSGNAVDDRSLWQKILEYKAGDAFLIGGILLLFAGMVEFTQYQMSGSLNPFHSEDRDYWQVFWDGNPQLERVDSYVHTSLVLVRDRPSRQTALFDFAVISYPEAHVKVLPCDQTEGLDPDMIYTPNANRVCFAIEHPESEPGGGSHFTFAASFSAKTSDSRVAQFYRELFAAHGKKIFLFQNSSRAVIMEAQDEHADATARISIRQSSDTVSAFLAWNSNFHQEQSPTP